MQKLVDDYISTKNAIMDRFNCTQDIYIKPIEDYYWRVKESDGMYILTYWKDGGKLNECIITKSGNRPLIIRDDEYTMLVCIECVKVGIIVRNSNHV